MARHRTSRDELQIAADIGDHHVADLEMNGGVGRVDRPCRNRGEWTDGGRHKAPSCQVTGSLQHQRWADRGFYWQERTRAGAPNEVYGLACRGPLRRRRTHGVSHNDPLGGSGRRAVCDGCLDRLPTDADARNGDALGTDMTRLLLPALAIVAQATTLADGGTVQLRKEVGNPAIAVFTLPAPLSVGCADISLLIQNRIGLEPVLAVRVVRRDKPAWSSE